MAVVTFASHTDLIDMATTTVSASDPPVSSSVGVPPVSLQTANVTNVGIDFAVGGVPAMASRPFREDEVELGTAPEPNDSYFSRPRNIYGYAWTSSANNFQMNPLSAYMNSLEIQNRYHYLSVFRGKLVLRFVINGMPFNYGRDVAAWFPRYPYNDGDTNAATQTNVMSATLQQRHHVLLDPSSVNSVDLHIPFVYEQPFVGIAGQEATAFRDFGTVSIWSIAPLQSTSLATPTPIDVTVYAWLESSVFAVPNPNLYTPSGPQTGSTRGRAWAAVERVAARAPEGGGKGPVSSVASAVAGAARSLADVPIIGAFATPVEVVANAASSLFTFLGFSRPAIVEPPTFVRQQPCASLANVLAADSGSTLTLDPRQAVSVGGATYGFNPVDEMTFSYIVSRWGFVSSATWNQASNPGDVLMQVPVSTALAFFNGASSYVPTPLAYVGLAHEYWSGSIDIRITVVCNKFHSGRLMLRYIPFYSGGTLASYTTATADACILDLAVENDIVLRVPWNSHQPVLRCAGTLQTAYGNAWDNGVIQVLALTGLQAPLATSAVSILSYIRGCEDMQFFNPTHLAINGYTPSGPEPPMGRGAHPEPRVCLITPGIVRSYPVERVVFGETVPSVRALVKRFHFGAMYLPFTTGGPPVAGTAYNLRVHLDSQPFANNTSVTGGTFTCGFLGYFARLYLGARGSIRYKAVDVPMATTTYVNHSALVGRESVYQSSVARSTGATVMNAPAAIEPALSTGTLNGGALFFQSQGAVEWTLPDYQPQLFRQTWYESVGVQPGVQPDSSVLNWLMHVTAYTSGNGPAIAVAQAAGEDFSLFWFQGCPIMT